MGEFDPSRTYAIPKLKWALVDPSGQPLSLHGDPCLALEAWVSKRFGLHDWDEKSRQSYFRQMVKAKYSIRPAQAWCRVQPYPLDKLPKEKRPRIAKKRKR